MTEQQRDALRRLIERHTRENASNRGMALAVLVKEGIATPEGRLTPEFGGAKRNGRDRA